MNPKFLVWVGTILIIGVMLMYVTHCGYEKLREQQIEETQ